jgi:hypothetical protein
METTIRARDDVVDFRPAAAFCVLIHWRPVSGAYPFISQTVHKTVAISGAILIRSPEHLSGICGRREEASINFLQKRTFGFLGSRPPETILHQPATYRTPRVPCDQLAKSSNMSDEMDLDGSNTKRAV